jgi:DMSO/TMAO reductase YedYZ molybdopterin-dependent catalytic subunit
MQGDDKKPVPPLPVRKQAFAERQAAKGAGLFAGEEPRGSGPPNRHGMPRLPVGQRQVKDWPVLDLGDVPEIDLAVWRLDVDGCVELPLSLGWSDLMALPQVEDVSDFHCVTTWSRFDNRWSGVRFADVVGPARPRAEARYVLVTAYDEDPSSGEAYTTNLALDEALEDDVLLVHGWEGRPLPREHGGPLRMITPRLYAWKGAKWIRRITLLEDDHPGFWEVRGYSNTAHPWFDDRYSRRR